MSLDDLLDNYTNKGGAPRLKSEFRGPAPVQAPASAPAPTPAPTPTPAPVPAPAPPVSKPTSRNIAEYFSAIGSSGGSVGELHTKEPELISRVYSCKNGVPGSSNGTLVLMPQRIFKPIGISLFGCNSKTVVSCQVGNNTIFHGVYGRFFEDSRLTYDDMLVLLPPINKAKWMPTFEVCGVGIQIVVHYSDGPLTAFVVWGHDVEIV